MPTELPATSAPRLARMLDALKYGGSQRVLRAVPMRRLGLRRLQTRPPLQNPGVAIDRFAAAPSRDSYGTPFSVRTTALLPLKIVEHPRVKAALPYLGHGAYFALASGFLMTDILTLRMLLVGGYSGLVAFHCLHPRPLRIPLRWSAFFVLVNVGMALQLARERWPGGISDDEHALYKSFFADKLSPSQFKWLLALGERRTLPPGTRRAGTHHPRRQPRATPARTTLPPATQPPTSHAASRQPRAGQHAPPVG